MKSKRTFNALCLTGLLCCSFLFIFCGQVRSATPESFGSDSICARVLEIEGVVESKMSGEKTKLLNPGDFVKIGEELNIRAESWVSLVMADSTVRKFNGPATITLKEDFPKAGGSVLTRLGSAVVGLLFAREEERSEEVMAIRTFESLKESKSYLPLLVHPASGSVVLEKPTKFEWRKIEGVPLYRVSVYSWDRLMWQGITSDSDIECPAEHCNFIPGERYYWVVEGLIGNSSLRSKAAEFEILPQDARSELYEALSDPNLSVSIKVRLCLNVDLYDKALELVNSHWEEESFDRKAYLLRAEIKEKMGLFEDAFLDYKSASSMPSVK